jgi:type IV secretion system protein VirD4
MEFQGTAYRHRLLMLLDEFPSLGRLAFFEGELPYLAGYGIKCFLIAQSLNQIEKAYGPNNAILDNCHIRVTYNALDERTAKRISDLLGQGTLLRNQRSFSGGRSWLAKVSHSEQEVGRPLLMPDEILRLPYDEALLMVGGLPPYHAKKIMYYLDSRFRDRAWLKPPESARSRAAELPPSRSPSEWLDVPRTSPELPSSQELPPLDSDEGAPIAPHEGQTSAGDPEVHAGPAGIRDPSSFNEAWATAFGGPSDEDRLETARAESPESAVETTDEAQNAPEDPGEDDRSSVSSRVPL